MQIKVIQTQKASIDGIRVDEYVEGQTYNLPQDLARVFITQKWGVEAREKVGPSEDKMVRPSRKKKAKR